MNVDDLVSKISNALKGKTIKIDSADLTIEAVNRVAPVSGGDCHAAFRLDVSIDQSQRTLFVKASADHRAAVLKSEHESLTLMADALGSAYAQLYPKVLGCISDQSVAVLLLEWLDLGPLSSSKGTVLADSLSRHHSVTNQDYGWPKDNYCGLTAQLNSPSTSWATFFVDRRLRYQLKLARQRGLPEGLTNQIEVACDTATQLLGNHQPTPALLHGDLWAGNVGIDSSSQRPVFYDPAPYYGDPEVDIAMTFLFGGFSTEFYTHWQKNLPSGTNFKSQEVLDRRMIYNLYHALNHFNLFGRAYIPLISDHLKFNF